MTTVLLLGGGTQGLAMTRAISTIRHHRVVLLCGEEHNYAEDSRYVWKRLSSNACVDKEEYLEQVLQTVEDYAVDVIIPMGDLSAVFVSKNKDILEKVTHIKTPQYESFLRGYDKNKLMTLCCEKGFPHPKTVDLSRVENVENCELLRSFPYPAMLKPNCSTGGRGMVEVSSYKELTDRYATLHEEYGDYHLQQFIQPGGRQMKVQLYVDAQQHLVASSVMQKCRWYPNKAGSNCCAVSVSNPEQVNICHQVLKEIGWVGFADFDLIEGPTTGQFLIMEINPRVPACIKLPIAAGINWAEIMVNDALERPLQHYDYKEGVCLRHLGLDLLWFIHAKNRWHTSPSWFHFIGRKVCYQDMSGWKDPMPFLWGTWHNVKKMNDPSFKNAKGL